jgi:hypothetical protein
LLCALPVQFYTHSNLSELKSDRQSWGRLPVTQALPLTMPLAEVTHHLAAHLAALNSASHSPEPQHVRLLEFKTLRIGFGSITKPRAAANAEQEKPHYRFETVIPTRPHKVLHFVITISCSWRCPSHFRLGFM